ncbi:MAG: ybbP [Chlamydiia bacterium]|nr:ybbP [Chlamydiia bacterium]
MPLSQVIAPFVVPTIEISFIAIAVYYLLSFFWNTRAMDLVLGIVVFLFIFLLATWLSFPVLQQLMRYFVNVAVIAILIIFQPELRLALAKMSVKGKRYEELTDFEKFLDSLTHSIYRMAERRVGAIILLENQDSLDEYAAKAVVLNAQFSSELLESVFAVTSPLHDGAVIIRGSTIVAASVILPLADESSQISRSMGTRHRAALGITQLRDTLSIVISEESGRVSIARDSIMTRGVKIDRFKGILRSIFNPPKTETTSKFALQEWLKPWKET